MLNLIRSMPLKIVCLIGCLFLVSGCSSAQAKPIDVRVVGASDVLPLVATLQPEFEAATKLTIDGQPTSNVLDDLQSSRADVALLGREPSPEELKNAVDVVIGYDAVCIDISSRTYYGGLQQADITGNLAQPISKFAGLPQLGLADYRKLLAGILLENKDGWYLPGSFFTFQPYTGDTGVPLVDPDNPDTVQGTWVWNAIPLQAELLTPGKFDTQVVLLDKLGIPPEELTKPGISFVPTQYGSEEELISWRYKLDSAKNMTTPVSSYDFPFYLLTASRRVTVRAIEHGFGLKALSIDGVDPLGDPQEIYSGHYPLSRKIHLLLKQPVAPAAQALADWLLSPQGQQIVAQARFLPLPK